MVNLLPGAFQQSFSTLHSSIIPLSRMDCARVHVCSVMCITKYSHAFTIRTCLGETWWENNVSEKFPSGQRKIPIFFSLKYCERSWAVVTFRAKKSSPNHRCYSQRVQPILIDSHGKTMQESQRGLSKSSDFASRPFARRWTHSRSGRQSSPSKTVKTGTKTQTIPSQANGQMKQSVWRWQA